MTDAQIAGGHKANINNPNTSQESKEHSKQVLESGDLDTSSNKDANKNQGNVAGGHKANLNNPNTSEESKQHSKEVLESLK